MLRRVFVTGALLVSSLVGIGCPSFEEVHQMQKSNIDCYFFEGTVAHYFLSGAVSLEVNYLWNAHYFDIDGRWTLLQVDTKNYCDINIMTSTTAEDKGD